MRRWIARFMGRRPIRPAAVVQWLKLRLRRVWLHWDRYPKDGTLIRPFCGVVEVRGWAVAPDGVRAIEVYCDDQLLGQAAVGLRRPDVFRLFPYARGSRRGGFQFVFDTTRVPNGHHRLTLAARTKRGRTGRLSAPIFVKNLATSLERYRRQTAVTAAGLAWMRRNLHHLPYRPRISLAVILADSTQLPALATTVQALIPQVYGDWQLLVAGTGRLDAKARAHLAQWTARDDRIILLESNGAPPDADGECVGRLEPGEVLTPEALFEMAYHLNRQPELDHSTRRTFLDARRKLDSGANEQPVVVVHAPCPQIELETVRSILIVKLDHLGDVLLTIPAMRRLHELCPEARIAALVGSWARPLIEAEPCIDEVLTYDFFASSSSRGCRRLTACDEQEIEALFVGRRFDLAIDLRREADTREFLWHSRATHTVGYANRGENDWLTVAIPWDEVHAVQPPRRHVALDALRLVEMVALSSRADAVTDYHLVCPANAEADRLLTGRLPAEPGLLMGLHPGAGRAIKCWPAERFARMADRMIEELGATVILFGTTDDMVQVEGVIRHVRRRDRLVSLAYELSLPQFMALLKRLDFFVGNDSGPTHMAAATGIPTLGVYAATIDASQWSPLGAQAAVIQRRMLCSPCYLAKKPDCPYGVACLQELSVEDVWKATVRVLLPKWSKIPKLQSRVARGPSRARSRAE